MDIFSTLVIIMQIVLLFVGIYFFYRKPFDIGTIMVFLFIIFYAVPAWDFYFDGDYFLKDILQYNVSYEDKSEGLYLIFITTLIMVFFYLGYLSIAIVLQKRSSGKIVYRINRQSFNSLFAIYGLIWMIIFLYSLNKYGQSILLFFSPSRKDGVFESSYISTFYLLIPLTLFTFKVLKDYVEFGKLKLSTCVYILPIISIYMTSGQRREIINLFIFLVILLTHLGLEKVKKKKIINETKYKRKRLLYLGLTTVILVPILWWARVIFTQLQRNDAYILMPWERRGFVELLFGSSSGGFKTLLLGLEHKQVYGLEWGYSIYFLFTSFIPRELMEDKPIIMNKLWQRDFNLMGNPSTFYINEMFINFGVISIIFSAIFGMILSYLYNKLYFSKSIVQNVMSFFIFSNVILLFKNGFTQFSINMFISLIFIGVSCKIILKKQKEQVE
ncbi:O-antigen polymerase [Metabacillus indicus]|uniref:O-antigen polymerase n=1 Tax=Metabacillus indicus TaxID=246786 RepID=UPI002A08870E|nr:O-antigen polymerase [Metabacillus indicus]MDX8289017.1 O-antigen polymerase [Metabacillus indicus]